MVQGRILACRSFVQFDLYEIKNGSISAIRNQLRYFSPAAISACAEGAALSLGCRGKRIEKACYAGLREKSCSRLYGK